MSRTVPAPIAQYFDGTNARDASAASLAFAADAVVHDEGRDHVGRSAIRHWLQDTIERYAMQSVIEETSEAADEIVVVAKLSGTFPGSPIRLRFLFHLVDGSIARLHIKP
jgi:ketosteroid isomerase-like protein